ncbi:hypothetical protein ACLVWU_14555 [Bdellovibrio sp. HCB290]|uniref:hypothetical protein n=1 Tax=Bdellovibrio sp. HCB290 TaxID=3394356 RepID=UPI0039B3DA8A
MKLLTFTFVSLFAVSAFAGRLTSAEINQKCLDVLVKNAATASIDLQSDIIPGEKLTDILAPLKSNNSNLKITNECVKISYDGIYQCQLIMSATIGEVGVEYAVFVGTDGQTPADKVLPNVYISRGH